jgi:hypothetical protein
MNKGGARMTELNNEELDLFIDWVQSNQLSESLEPPHAHLDDFFSNWKKFADKDYYEILKYIELSSVSTKGARYIALVFNIVEDGPLFEWWELELSQLLRLSLELNSPPAIYLPKRESIERVIDCFALHIYRMPDLDKYSFKARMTVNHWDSVVDEHDAHLEFVNL